MINGTGFQKIEISESEAWNVSDCNVDKHPWKDTVSCNLSCTLKV